MSDKRIVIADDDPGLLDYYRCIFSDRQDDALDFFSPQESADSFEMHTFPDGAPLVEFFKAEHAVGRRIPLCILDMRMPTMDGLTAAEAVRAIDPDVFIVIVTAYADVSAAEIRSRLKENIYYVKKPFYEDDLYSLVTSLFGNWSSRRALRESEQHYRDLVEQLNEGIICIDSQAHVDFVNRKLCEMVGYAEEELLGRPLHSLIARQYWETLNETLRLRREGKRFQYEVGFSTRDGRVVNTLASITPRFNADGTYRGSLAIVADLTQRLQMEKALIAAKEEAEAANQAKSQFLANMSHEIRTPMNGVLGMAQLLLQTDLDEDQHHMVEKVILSGKALLTVINDILDFSKIEAGKLELESIQFNLRDLIEDVKGLFIHEAEGKGLELVFMTDAAVPQVFCGDPGRLRQILINIVGNAMKFTGRGKIEVSTHVGDCADGMVPVEVEVRDTGVGIPFEAQGRIFNSFLQADGSMARRYGGTGLGLAICSELCELMGGSIYCSSIPGEGATFHITLRLMEAGSGDRETWVSPEPELLLATVEGRPEPVEHDGRGGDAVAPGYSGRVLVAEDTLVNGEILKFFLESLGNRVDLVEDGLQALEAASRVHYDLIIMDCQMPEMDGYEATKRIRELEASASRSSGDREPGVGYGSPCNGFCVPIIALTANAMEGDRQKCLSAGMNDYVAKPFSLQEITQVLNRWLPSRGSCARNDG